MDVSDAPDEVKARASCERVARALQTQTEPQQKNENQASVLSCNPHETCTVRKTNQKTLLQEKGAKRRSEEQLTTNRLPIYSASSHASASCPLVVPSDFQYKCSCFRFRVHFSNDISRQVVFCFGRVGNLFCAPAPVCRKERPQMGRRHYCGATHFIRSRVPQCAKSAIDAINFNFVWCRIRAARSSRNLAQLALTHPW